MTIDSSPMEALLPGLDSGPLHPALVHFPIALWIVATLSLLLGLLGRESAWSRGVWLLHAGTIGALVAVASGLIAADALGHDSAGHDYVHDHRNLMIAATALGLGASVLAWVKRAEMSPLVRKGLTALMLATCLVLTLGADRGANLVYRYGVGTSTDGSNADSHGSAGHDAPENHEKPKKKAGDHGH